MTAFQRNAVNKIHHIGGSIYYATDKRWVDSHGERVFVPAFDLKTEGFIGWPTIRELISEGALYHREGNEYSLTYVASKAKRAA
jgi:hypothetical protein